MVSVVASASCSTRMSRKAQHSDSAVAATSTRSRMSVAGRKRRTARPGASDTDTSPSLPSVISCAARDTKSAPVRLQVIGSGWVMCTTLCGASARTYLVHHLVVSHTRLADQVALILRIEHGGLDVIARESADGVLRLPQRQRDELGPLALVAAEHPRAAVARGLAVLREAGVADVLGVLLGILATHDASPGSRDHRPASSPDLRLGSAEIALDGLRITQLGSVRILTGVAKGSA